MKAILLLVSLLVLSSVASAQITQPENNQPQDGEQGWVQIPTGSTTAWLRSVTATPSGTVWAGGPDLMLKSTNFGVDWAQAETPVKGLIKFYDDSTGILADGPNSVFLTNDGGKSWLPGNSTESQVLHNVAYASKTNVFAVGIAGVSKSTNGGKTWFNRQLDASDLNCIHFADSLHGFIGAARPSIDFGSMFRTKDGGESWQEFHTPPFNWHGVFGLSKDTIFLTTSGGYLFKSTDGGNSWQQKLFTELGWGPDGITFINNEEGFVGDGRGRIYYSSDRGETWQPQLAPLTSNISSIDFINDSIGFASGLEGVLLKTTTKGKSTVEGLKFKQNLSIQVYPEPVTGKTTLKYVLPEDQRVSVIFYSLDGKVQATILNAVFQNAGSQSVLIDATNWAPGTYVYQLECDRFSGTGRITVLH